MTVSADNKAAWNPTAAYQTLEALAAKQGRYTGVDGDSWLYANLLADMGFAVASPWSPSNWRISAKGLLAIKDPKINQILLQ